MSEALGRLLRHPGIWRPGSGAPVVPALATGFAELDARLPGGGWPRGALTEIVCGHRGIGELRLVVSALARLSRAGRWVVWVASPHVPYAPALHAAGVSLSRVLVVSGADHGEALWGAEQCLRSTVCGAVLMWCGAIQGRVWRRLQLAAEVGGGIGLVFSVDGAPPCAPAALRLHLQPASRGLGLRVLKCRGGLPGATLRLDLR